MPTDQRLGVSHPFAHTQDHRALDLQKQGSGAVTVQGLRPKPGSSDRNGITVGAGHPCRISSVVRALPHRTRPGVRRVRHQPRAAGPAGTGLRHRRRSAGSLCCSFAWWCQQVCDHGDRGRHETVVRPDTALVALEQSGLGQDSKVMTHGRLGEPERCGEVRYGRLSVRSRLDKAEQPQPGRVRERLQHSCQPFGIGAFHRLARKGRDGRYCGLYGSHVLHRCSKLLGVPAEPGSARRVALSAPSAALARHRASHWVFATDMDDLRVAPNPIARATSVQSYHQIGIVWRLSRVNVTRRVVHSGVASAWAIKTDGHAKTEANVNEMLPGSRTGPQRKMPRQCKLSAATPAVRCRNRILAAEQRFQRHVRAAR